MITSGLDLDAVEQLSETLMTMKATLVQEPRASRRSVSAAHSSPTTDIADSARELA
jgi:hypothetical protein